MKHCKSLLVSTFASGKLGNLLGYFQTQDSLSVFHHSLIGVHRVAWSVRSHTGYLEIIIWRKATHSRTSSHLLMATGKKGETGNITIWDFSDRISCSSHATWVVPRRHICLTVPIYGVHSLEKHKGVVKTLEWVKGHLLFHPIRKLSDLIKELKLANGTNCM